jgi:hypothetical protein
MGTFAGFATSKLVLCGVHNYAMLCWDVQVVGRKPGRKSYALRAASKSVMQQYFFMTQLPSVFGFVSPMITFFALGIQNFWIKLAIIVGAVLIFIYMVLCAFHRKLMAPSKHRPVTP